MKAAQINQYGGTEVMEINPNASKPVVKPGQVLVEIYASGINPFDMKIRQGYLKEQISLNFPATLGGDFAGVVKELGANVSEFKIGDEIYGTAIVLGGGSGSYAELAAVNVKNAALKPHSANFEQATALPLVGSSAIQALEEHIKLQPKQKILIHGGAGGIGHLAIQLAKTLGAYVATTVSSPDLEFAKNLGADEIVDYKSQKFEQMLVDFDAVFDTVGGETTDKSFKVLKPGGILVSMLGQPSPQLAAQYKVTVIGQFTQVNSEHLQRLAELVDQGKLTPHIDRVFPLSEAKQAFEYFEKEHPKGKVVITMKA